MSDALSSRNGVDRWNLDPDTVHLLINKQLFEPFYRCDELRHVNTEPPYDGVNVQPIIYCDIFH